MKILFLDIDGVLNSFRTCFAFGGTPIKLEDQTFDLVAVALIRKLCHELNVEIVLSSSWRILYDFKEVGKALDLPIIGCTPKFWECGSGGNRGTEIAKWLHDNPQVRVYAIVDDDSDMLEEQMPYFVKTNPVEGLSIVNTAKLAEILSENLGINQWARDIQCVIRDYENYTYETSS